MKKNIWRILLALALIAAFIYVPRVSAPQLQRDIYLEWLSGEPVAWKGVLRLWNVYDGELRLSRDYLSTAVAKYEKRNKGVYVDILTLSIEQAERRLKEDFPQPDIWIYPIPGSEDDIDYLLMQRIKLPEVKSESFEFDVEPPTAEEWERFGVVVSSIDGLRAQAAHDLCAYLAVQAQTMLK